MARRESKQNTADTTLSVRKNPTLVECKSLKPLSRHIGAYLMKGFGGLKGDDAYFSATPLEVFSARVYERVIELDNCLEAMRISIVEMSSIAKSANSEAKLFRYYYENYVLRLSGLLDRTYRMIGTVLEIPEEKLNKIGSNALVLKISKESSPAIHSQLEKLRELLAARSQARNKIAHSGVFSSREIGLFTVLEQVKHMPIDRRQVQELMVEHFCTEVIEISHLTIQSKAYLHELLHLIGPTIRLRVNRVN